MAKGEKNVHATNGLEFPRPLTTVDVAIFTVLEDSLRVLLVKRPDTVEEPFPGAWALPGGFVDVNRDDSLEACARRKLTEKTGVETPYLEQLGSWGGRNRDPRGWSATHVYFALIPSEDVVLEQGANATEAAWFGTKEAAEATTLAFDHEAILQAALTRLRNKVEYTSLPAYLLPDEFTLGELQHMYEVVLERPVEKSAFRTRILASGLVMPAGQKMREGPNRPAQLYRLNEPQHPVVFPRTFNPKRN